MLSKAIWIFTNNQFNHERRLLLLFDDYYQLQNLKTKNKRTKIIIEIKLYDSYYMRNCVKIKTNQSN